MRPYREITDDQWRQIAPMLPESRPRRDPRGRPLSNTRAVLNGVMWVLSSGSSWASLPRTFPPYQTCHRRFKVWHDEGVLERILSQLLGASGDATYQEIVGRMRSGRERSTAARQAAALRPPLPGDMRRHRVRARSGTGGVVAGLRGK